MKAHPYKIRIATKEDIEQVSLLIIESIDQLEDRDYSEAQWTAWKAINMPEELRDKMKKRVIFCAFEAEEMVGTIGLEENELVALYISPRKKRRGIGSILLAHLEAYAFQQRVKELVVVSIPAAKSFYARHGFIITQEVLTIIKGVEYEETKMVKLLFSS